MKKCILILFVLLCADVLIAQSDIQVMGRFKDDMVQIRWAPSSPIIWELANKHGYNIDRIAMVKEKKLLERREVIRLNHKPIRPFPLLDWEVLMSDDSISLIAAQALYGERFEINEQEGFEQVVSLQREQSSRYSMALLAADISIVVARASALYYEDRNVESNVSYLYRISIDTLGCDTGFVYLNPLTVLHLQAVRNLKVKVSEHDILLTCLPPYEKSMYSGYYVEHSLDSLSFQRLNEIPIVSLKNQERISSKMKIEDNLIHYYRVQGISPFGELGPYSVIVQAKAKPKIIPPQEFSVKGRNDGILLTWDFPAELKNSIREFEVYRANDMMGDYLLLDKVDSLSFLDAQTLASNYYKIASVSHGGQKYFTSTIYCEKKDSIPPSAPSQVQAIVNDEGEVVLRWEADEDARYYQVYRANAMHEEFSLRSNHLLDTAIFKDQINLRTLSSTVFYKVVSLDARFNRSQFSTVLGLARPDTISPVAPILLSIKNENDGIALNWICSSSQDVTHSIIYYKVVDQWRELERVLQGIEDYIIATIPSGNISYALAAMDINSNVSALSVKAIEGDVVLDEPRLSVRADRLKNCVVLEWKEVKDNAFVKIYRAIDDTPLRLYTTVDLSEGVFIDKNIQMDITYNYMIKVVYPSGVLRSSELLTIDY